MVRTLDRAVGESQPETVAALMRDIDRAFDAFDLMAVSHGWHGARGLNAGIDRINDAEQRWSASDCVEDLPDFVSAVIEAETNERSSILGEISLPKNWVHGLDGLPGLDPPLGRVPLYPQLRSPGMMRPAGERGFLAARIRWCCARCAMDVESLVRSLSHVEIILDCC